MELHGDDELKLKGAKGPWADLVACSRTARCRAGCLHGRPHQSIGGGTGRASIASETRQPEKPINLFMWELKDPLVFLASFRILMSSWIFFISLLALSSFQLS